MKNSIDILDAISRAHGDCSDYRIGKLTGIPHSKISGIRAGKCSMSRTNCKRAALALGVEPGALIAIAQAEREEDEEIAASLLRVANRGLAAAAGAAQPFVYYVKCDLGRKFPPHARAFPVIPPRLTPAMVSAPGAF